MISVMVAINDVALGLVAAILALLGAGYVFVLMGCVLWPRDWRRR